MQESKIALALLAAISLGMMPLASADSISMNDSYSDGAFYSGCGTPDYPGASKSSHASATVTATYSTDGTRAVTGAGYNYTISPTVKKNYMVYQDVRGEDPGPRYVYRDTEGPFNYESKYVGGTGFNNAFAIVLYKADKAHYDQTAYTGKLCDNGVNFSEISDWIWMGADVATIGGSVRNIIFPSTGAIVNMDGSGGLGTINRIEYGWNYADVLDVQAYAYGNSPIATTWTSDYYGSTRDGTTASGRGNSAPTVKYLPPIGLLYGSANAGGPWDYLGATKSDICGKGATYIDCDPYLCKPFGVGSQSIRQQHFRLNQITGDPESWSTSSSFSCNDSDPWYACGAGSFAPSINSRSVECPTPIVDPTDPSTTYCNGNFLPKATEQILAWEGIYNYFRLVVYDPIEANPPAFVWDNTSDEHMSVWPNATGYQFGDLISWASKVYVGYVPTTTCNGGSTTTTTPNNTLTCTVNAAPDPNGTTSPVTWTTQILDKDGNPVNPALYTFVWTGTDNLAATVVGNSAVQKQYSTMGQKNAIVQVVKTATNETMANCQNNTNIRGQLEVECTGKIVGNASSTEPMTFPIYIDWMATPYGGSGKENYTYNWTGSNGLSGDTPMVEYEYNSLSPMKKLATVTVNDTITGETVTANCDVQFPFSARCSPSPAAATIGTQVTWTATPNPLNPPGLSYSYEWSGTNNLSGTTRQVQKTYTAPGTKSAQVKITLGTDTMDVVCDPHTARSPDNSTPTCSITAAPAGTINNIATEVTYTINYSNFYSNVNPLLTVTTCGDSAIMSKEATECNAKSGTCTFKCVKYSASSPSEPEIPPFKATALLKNAEGETATCSRDVTVDLSGMPPTCIISPASYTNVAAGSNLSYIINFINFNNGNPDESGLTVTCGGTSNPATSVKSCREDLANPGTIADCNATCFNYTADGTTTVVAKNGAQDVTCSPATATLSSGAAPPVTTYSCAITAPATAETTDNVDITVTFSKHVTVGGNTTTTVLDPMGDYGTILQDWTLDVGDGTGIPPLFPQNSYTHNYATENTFTITADLNSQIQDLCQKDIVIADNPVYTCELTGGTCENSCLCGERWDGASTCEVAGDICCKPDPASPNQCYAAPAPPFCSNLSPARYDGAIACRNAGEICCGDEIPAGGGFGSSDNIVKIDFNLSATTYSSQTPLIIKGETIRLVPKTDPSLESANVKITLYKGEKLVRTLYDNTSDFSSDEAGASIIHNINQPLANLNLADGIYTVNAYVTTVYAGEKIVTDNSKIGNIIIRNTVPVSAPEINPLLVIFVGLAIAAIVAKFER